MTTAGLDLMPLRKREKIERKRECRTREREGRRTSEVGEPGDETCNKFLGELGGKSILQ